MNHYSNLSALQAELHNLTNFDSAELDFDPICLKGKFWEFIKEDFLDFVKPN